MPWVVKQQWRAHSSPLQPIIKKGFMEACKSVLSLGGLHNKIEVKLKPRGAKNCGWASKKLWWCPIPTTCGTTPVRPLLCGWQLHEGQEHRLVHGMKSATKAEWTDEQFPSRMGSQNNWAAANKHMSSLPGRDALRTLLRGGAKEREAEGEYWMSWWPEEEPICQRGRGWSF